MGQESAGGLAIILPKRIQTERVRPCGCVNNNRFVIKYIANYEKSLTKFLIYGKLLQISASDAF